MNDLIKDYKNLKSGFHEDNEAKAFMAGCPSWRQPSSFIQAWDWLGSTRRWILRRSSRLTPQQWEKWPQNVCCCCCCCCCKKWISTSTVHLTFDDLKWRSDMQFLCELRAAYRYFKEHDHYPYINFRSLSNLSNARWNSRVILTLSAFLCHNYNQNFTVCDFICGTWYNIWFSKHIFNENNFYNKNDKLNIYQKAQYSFQKH